MQLYKIANEYREAYQALLELDISEDEIQDSLAGIEEELTKKLLSLGSTVVRIEDEIDILAKHIERLQQRLKQFKNKKAYITKYMREEMEKCELSYLHTPEMDLKIKRNPGSVFVEDEAKIPQKYFKENFITVIDKTKIKKDLLSDQPIPGVMLVKSTRLEIR